MNLDEYKKVQRIAKKVHSLLGEFITVDSTEFSISEKAKELLIEFGASETWYHKVPAFVLLGSRSCLSISGKDYMPSNEKVGLTNLVTVDLSPKINNIWGDRARSFIVENGGITENPKSQEFIDGLFVEKQLHKEMVLFVTPTTKFSELFEYGNKLIKEYGYENLDFLSNLGHSIETNPDNRRFIDNNCHEELGDVSFFTFEPHIRKSEGKWGFKHENIYCFNERNQAISL